MNIPEHDPKVPRTIEDDILSSNHHYIPKFYLKGFTNPSGKLFVYDKQTNRIRQTTPAGAFYEKHGNKGYIQNPETGERHWTDLAERLFGGMETSLAGALAIIRGTDATINAMATPAVVDAIKQLIHFLFWRTPVNRDKLDAILHTYSFKDFGFGIFNEKGTRDPNVEKLMTTIDLWRKCSPAMLASARSFSRYHQDNNTHWCIYYQAMNHYLVTDNPVLLRSYADPSSMEDELFFPLAGDQLAIAGAAPKKDRADPKVREQLDVLFFQQAAGYVASSKKEYLSHIADAVQFYASDGPGWEAELKIHVFQHFIA